MSEILCGIEGQYSVHRSRLQDRIMRQMHPVIFTPQFFKIHYVILPFPLRFTSDQVPHLHLFISVIFGEKYQLSRFSLCKFSDFLLLSASWVQILLSGLTGFSDTRNKTNNSPRVLYRRDALLQGEGRRSASKNEVIKNVFVSKRQ